LKIFLVQIFQKKFQYYKDKTLTYFKILTHTKYTGPIFPHQSPQKAKETMGHDGHGPWLNNFWRNGFISPPCPPPNYHHHHHHLSYYNEDNYLHFLMAKIVAQTTLLYPTLTNFLDLCQH
jgi:hypothetical protein